MRKYLLSAFLLALMAPEAPAHGFRGGFRGGVSVNVRLRGGFGGFSRGFGGYGNFRYYPFFSSYFSGYSFPSYFSSYSFPLAYSFPSFQSYSFPSYDFGSYSMPSSYSAPPCYGSSYSYQPPQSYSYSPPAMPYSDTSSAPPVCQSAFSTLRLPQRAVTYLSGLSSAEAQLGYLTQTYGSTYGHALFLSTFGRHAYTSRFGAVPARVKVIFRSRGGGGFGAKVRVRARGKGFRTRVRVRLRAGR